MSRSPRTGRSALLQRRSAARCPGCAFPQYCGASGAEDVVSPQDAGLKQRALCSCSLPCSAVELLFLLSAGDVLVGSKGAESFLSSCVSSACRPTGG